MSNPTGKLMTTEESLKRRQKEERIKFGQNLKERRRLLNLTQENVAEMLRITVTAYSKIERGETGEYAKHSGNDQTGRGFEEVACLL